MKKKEILIVFCLFLLALAVYGIISLKGKAGHRITVRNAENEILLDITDKDDGLYMIEGKRGVFHLEVKDGSWRAVDVDCPDKICEKQGWVSEERYVPIICLPNGILVTLDE